MSLKAKQSLDLSSKIGLSKKRILQYVRHFSNQVYILDNQTESADVLIHMMKKEYPNIEWKIEHFHTLPQNKMEIQPYMTTEDAELEKDYSRYGCIRFDDDNSGAAAYCRPLSFWSYEDIQEYKKINQIVPRETREKKVVMETIERIADSKNLNYKRFEFELLMPGMTVMRNLVMVREAIPEGATEPQEYYSEIFNHSYCDISGALHDLKFLAEKFEKENDIFPISEVLN